MGFEAGTFLATSGAKPAEPEDNFVNGEEMQCVGPVMNSTGRMRETFANADGGTQLKNNDALDELLAVHRSLSDVVGDAPLDDNRMCAAMLKSTCQVKLNDAIGYGTTTAQSTMYGFAEISRGGRWGYYETCIDCRFLYK